VVDIGEEFWKTINVRPTVLIRVKHEVKLSNKTADIGVYHYGGQG